LEVARCGADGLPLEANLSTIAFRWRLAGDAPAAKARPKQREEENVAQPRAADDFRAIRARMEELRRERERVDSVETDVRSMRVWYRANTDPIIISIGRPSNGVD
jgi:hypothetical protein